MADKTIGELPASSGLDDSALLPVWQNNQTQSITGAQVRSFAEASAEGVVDQYVTEAQGYAQAAANSAAEAAESVAEIGGSVSQAQSAAQTAQTASTSAESAKTAAQTAQSAAETAQQDAEASAETAASAVSTTAASAAAAESAKTSAEAAKTAAVTAKTAAETAQASAESAAQSAQTQASTATSAAETATSKASEASASATTAAQAAMSAQAAQEAIENMQVEAETLATGQPATVTKSTAGDAVKLTFGLPTGAKGDPGNNIQSITRTSGTGAPGTTDTYTVTLTDGSTGGTFTVYNGADGEGAGDMTKIVYDPRGKNTDVFQYVDDSISNVDAESIKFSDGETYQDKYDSGELTGPPGTDGTAATISVGTVTTGEAGTTASVTNSGTSSAAVFDFSIPRGNNGTDGKSAYEYAVDAGYTGTEEELSEALASLGDLNSILDNINGEVV